jgi:predicted secreted protein
VALPGYNALISCATGASETYTPLDGISQFSVSDQTDQIDITDFTDSNLRRRLSTMRDITISMSGQLESTSSAWQRVKACYDAQSVVYIRIQTTATRGYTYAMLAESFEISATVDGSVDLSVNLNHEGTVDPISFGGGF